MEAQEDIGNILQRFLPKPLENSRKRGKRGRKIGGIIIKKGHSYKW